MNQGERHSLGVSPIALQIIRAVCRERGSQRMSLMVAEGKDGGTWDGYGHTAVF